jgi:DNA-binding CsgD family transcriptional regulator
VAIPLHGPRGELAGIGLASDNSRNVLSEMDKAILYSISKHFHLNYCKLSSKDKKFIPSSITLTNRETEILKWWASGKTSDEIATILSCSQSNIKWHIKNIYEKLDANEKVLAITKAIRLGLILSSPYR